MNRKPGKWIGFTLILAITIFVPTAYACGKDKTCSYSQTKGHYSKGLKSIFVHKAHFILKHKEALGLTDEEVQKIKALKRSVKKDLIMKKAEIEALSVDIKAALHESPVDAKTLNDLYDEKYNLKKAKSKTLVQAYAELKNGLTATQKQTMKSLWKETESKK